jgi:transcriptional regulator with XRE-family HTH domain
MDNVRFGALVRAIRIRKNWRQQDLAVRARMSRSVVSRIERGRCASVSVGRLRRLGTELEMSLDIVPRWRGGDAAWVLNAGHAALHEAVAAFLSGIGGWEHAPEVSYSIYGERGVIDILAFHPATGSLLVIELKTEIADFEDLLGSMDRRLRLASTISSERGWNGKTVSGWVIVAASDANRRRVRRHETALRSAFPADGVAARAWIRNPIGRLRALSLWANAPAGSSTARMAPRKRVRAPNRAPNRG